MMNEQLNQVFDYVDVPEFSSEKRQQTIDQAQAAFKKNKPVHQESHSARRPINNQNTKWTMFWRTIMDSTTKFGPMVTVSLVALTLGVGVFQFTSHQTLKLTDDEQAVFETAVTIESDTTQPVVQQGVVSEVLIQEEGVDDYANQRTRATTSAGQTYKKAIKQLSASEAPRSLLQPYEPEQSVVYPKPGNNNKFNDVQANPVKQTIKQPVSTFSIDTDTASYSFIRRQLKAGNYPQADSVRIEELINYFDYNYPVNPDLQTPFTVTTRVVPSPWNDNNKLIHIGIKAFEHVVSDKPKSNLVFLIDTSGSMQSEDKLPLLINSLRLLVNTLDENDRVSIVTYAGTAGTVLEPTAVKSKSQINNALERLTAGGSTAGQAGIAQAYALARQHYDSNAINRVFLATDGDFNVGINDPNQLKDYIQKKRDSGVYLSVLGFGDGNYNDHLMQTLAQNGNGQAFYIDTLNEAQKILVDQATSTLFPVAKDVKIQIEFNPNTVAEYRLIGYETRQLNREDFNNDRIDAGEVGAGHTVTAIYEITPVDALEKVFDEPRYDANQAITAPESEFNNEYAFLKIRYKKPDSTISQKITTPVSTNQEVDSLSNVDADVRFAIAVAAFGQLLEQNAYIGNMTFSDVLKWAKSARGEDEFGYRSEFIQLINLANSLNQNG